MCTPGIAVGPNSLQYELEYGIPSRILLQVFLDLDAEYVLEIEGILLWL